MPNSFTRGNTFVLREHRFLLAPDFKGLDVMVSNRLDLGGPSFVGDFAKWTAEEQKSEAFTMKQQRLYSEEMQKKLPKEEGGGGKK